MSSSLVGWIIIYGYWAIIPIAIVEGPILSMICGLLIRVGILHFLPAYLLLMAGDLIGDTLWYALGFYWGKALVLKYGKYFSITEKSLAVIEKLYQRFHNWILFISKLLMGFGFPGAVLTAAGMAKVPFRKYFMINVLGQIIWTGGLLAVGYYLGEAYLTINGGLDIFTFIGLILAAILILFGLGKYIRKKTLEKYS